MIRMISAPASVYDTTSARPIAEMPMTTKRDSPTEWSGSENATDNGSSKTLGGSSGGSPRTLQQRRTTRHVARTNCTTVTTPRPCNRMSTAETSLESEERPSPTLWRANQSGFDGMTGDEKETRQASIGPPRGRFRTTWQRSRKRVLWSRATQPRQSSQVQGSAR